LTKNGNLFKEKKEHLGNLVRLFRYLIITPFFSSINRLCQHHFKQVGLFRNPSVSDGKADVIFPEMIDVTVNNRWLSYLSGGGGLDGPPRS